MRDISSHPGVFYEKAVRHLNNCNTEEPSLLALKMFGHENDSNDSIFVSHLL